VVFWIAGRISDKVTVEYGFRDEFSLNPFRSAIANNYGGAYTDYYIYSVDESDADALRVKDGDEFSAAWTDDAITGLDFSEQDARKWIRFYASKSNIIVGGSDEVIVSSKVYESDKSEIDTTFSENVDVMINTPLRSYKMRFTFSQGQASRIIVPDVAGEWFISPSHNIGDDLCVDKSYVASFNSIA